MAVLLVIVLVSFIYALWKIAKEKKELRLAGLHNFEKGMTEAINPDLTLDQQTDSLPYDPKWEFPSSKLKLGALCFFQPQMRPLLIYNLINSRQTTGGRCVRCGAEG